MLGIIELEILKWNLQLKIHETVCPIMETPNTIVAKDSRTSYIIVSDATGLLRPLLR